MTVAVSRDGSQRLADGVETRLRRVDAVESVESLELEGVQPGLNDLTAEVTTTLRVDPDAATDRASLAAALQEPYAVSEVTVTALRDDGHEPPGEVVDAA